MEELRIKCPSCGIILDVRNSRGEAVKRIVCPNCKKNLAITFREESKDAVSAGMLHFGEAEYILKEGINVIGRKHPSSKADIQIATGDETFSLEHAIVTVRRLNDGRSKAIVKMANPEKPVFVGDQPLLNDDEIVLSKNDEIGMGDTILIYR